MPTLHRCVGTVMSRHNPPALRATPLFRGDKGAVQSHRGNTACGRSRDGCGCAGSTLCFAPPISFPTGEAKGAVHNNVAAHHQVCHCEASKKPWQSQGSCIP